MFHLLVNNYCFTTRKNNFRKKINVSGNVVVVGMMVVGVVEVGVVVVGVIVVGVIEVGVGEGSGVGHGVTSECSICAYPCF